jgi:hypothetical protein
MNESRFIHNICRCSIYIKSQKTHIGIASGSGSKNGSMEQWISGQETWRIQAFLGIFRYFQAIFRLVGWYLWVRRGTLLWEIMGQKRKLDLLDWIPIDSGDECMAGVGAGVDGWVVGRRNGR